MMVMHYVTYKGAGIRGLALLVFGIASARSVACGGTTSGGISLDARAGAGVHGLPCSLADAYRELIRIEEDVAAFSLFIALFVHRDFRIGYLLLRFLKKPNVANKGDID